MPRTPTTGAGHRSLRKRRPAEQSAGAAATMPASPAGAAAALAAVAAMLLALAALALAALTATAFAPAALVPTAHAEVWTTSSGVRIFSSAAPGLNQAISLSAARNEYEGVQIGLRGAWQRDAVVEWLPGSHPLLVTNSKLHEVKYVKVTRPTTSSGGAAGYYPDPLVPRTFGAPFTVGNGAPAPYAPYTPGTPKNTPLYVLFHVPLSAAAGTYTGTLRVTNGPDEVVDLPVTLRVWSFGWQRLSTPTAFVVSVTNLGKSIEGSGVEFKKQNRQRIVLAAYRMLQEHGITPFMLDTLPPKVKADGSFDAAAYRAAVEPYLGAGRLDLQTTQYPWTSWFPYQPWRRTPQDPNLVNYLAGMARFYRDNGWKDRAYGFILDEPANTEEERYVEVMARTLHKASARAGFRAPFMVTDDPRPKRLHPLLPKNSFLFNDVDIWASRYYYYFGRVPVLRKLQKQGVKSWWYTYCNSKVKEMPNFVLEKGLADQRAWGWLTYEWKVDGILYWATNRWGDAKTGKGWRDPYKDPLSYWVPGARVCNGEANLIYPGYYPRYGLNDPFAEPVSSLRLESWRDGLEDLEYLRMAEKAGSGAKRWVKSVVAGITWYPHKVRYGHVFTYPRYRRSAGYYTAAREVLAQRIEPYWAK